VFVQPVNGWRPEDYVLKLQEVLRGSGTYKDKVHLHTRCVCLEYSGDFEIDVVPCIVNRPGSTSQYEVCNRTENKFEPTDGEAYTAWLAQRNDWVGADKLREVTRLLKYLRDNKTTFSCKSILLTTLLGERVAQADALYQATYFPDLPTALKTLAGRLDDYLQDRPKLHDTCNPVLPKENFNRHWDEDKYANFRDMIHKYRGWIDDAYNEPDQAKSVTKWQRIFDDDFAKSATNATALVVANASPPLDINISGYKDAVNAVKLVGRGILTAVRQSLPWVKSPPWSEAKQGRLSVQVRASLHQTQGGQSVRPIESGELLPKNMHLLFDAIAGNGVPFGTSKDYQVHWQVVNTDHDAYHDRALRGGFYRSEKTGKRWERTLYRGIHWVQAFVVRRRDGRCIGHSDQFFVVIE
jgi:hypothetical protein